MTVYFWSDRDISPKALSIVDCCVLMSDERSIKAPLRPQKPALSKTASEQSTKFPSAKEKAQGDSNDTQADRDNTKENAHHQQYCTTETTSRFDSDEDRRSSHSQASSRQTNSVTPNKVLLKSHSSLLQWCRHSNFRRVQISNRNASTISGSKCCTTENCSSE